VVARHETMAMMAVHIPRIQNLVVGGAPPPPSWACPFGGPGAVRLSFRMMRRISSQKTTENYPNDRFATRYEYVMLFGWSRLFRRTVPPHLYTK
jgi:hypothetical protein